MVTTKFDIKPHLREYLIAKYNKFDNSAPIRFPDDEDLYHSIWDLLQKRPVNVPIDNGNLEIAIPCRQCGKNPQVYNYLSDRGQKIIAKKIEVKFLAELHDFVDEQKHMYGIQYAESIFSFIGKYGIESITSDALLKNYQRWKDRVRKKKQKRAYVRA